MQVLNIYLQVRIYKDRKDHPDLIDDVVPGDSAEGMPHAQTDTSENHTHRYWSQIVYNRTWHQSFSRGKSNRILDDSQEIGNRRCVRIIGRQCRDRNDGSKVFMPSMNSSKSSHSLQSEASRYNSYNAHRCPERRCSTMLSGVQTSLDNLKM